MKLLTLNTHSLEEPGYVEKTEKFMEDTGMIENPVDVASLILNVK